MRLLILIFFVLIINPNWSQQILLEDIFNGGVTGDGYNPSFSTSPGNFDLQFEAGSSIRKAYLFGSKIGNPPNDEINFGGTPLSLVNANYINVQYLSDFISYSYNQDIFYVDVTSLLNEAVSTYELVPPQTNSGLTGTYLEFYLIVLYENPSLTKTNFVIAQNTLQTDSLMLYNFQGLNPINSSKPVALAAHVGAYCDTIQDGSLIFINNYFLGVIGGAEHLNDPSLCGGYGSFYFQNDQLFGLDNDTPDSFMSGNDILADIATYIDLPSTFDVRLAYQSNLGLKSNPIHQLFLTYTTPCDTFSVTVPNDTTICKGEIVQLNVSGGSSAPLTHPTYEWSSPNPNALTDLSCIACPNPIFSGDTSCMYTVRIWNTDSCSVVRPVHITVVPPAPEFDVITLATPCSDSSGVATVTGLGSAYQYSIDNGNFQNNPSFSDLSAGSHLVFIKDGNSCTNSMEIEIPMTYPTAQFTATPQQGEVPLEVQFTNQSTNASNYSWLIGNDSYTTEDVQLTFTDEGVFDVVLVAYDTYPQCADTATVQIFTSYPFTVFAPSLYEQSSVPYQIYVTGASELQFELLNMAGQLVLKKAMVPIDGYNEMMLPSTLAAGMYFIRINAKNEQGEEKEFAGKLLVH